MKLTESFYVDGRAVGMIVQDSLSGIIAFIPKEGKQTPPKRAWGNVDELKSELRKHYGGPTAYKRENPR
jgi:hypothetical protein